MVNPYLILVVSCNRDWLEPHCVVRRVGPGAHIKIVMSPVTKKNPVISDE